MANQVLNEKAFQAPIEPVKKHRIGAILLEWIPISLIFIGFLMQIFELLIYPSFALILIYALGGWYIFKGSKYRTINIIFVTLTAIFVLFPLIMSNLYKFFDWPGADEMCVISIYPSPLFIIISAIWYFSRRQDVLEFRFSLKLLSRILFLVVLQFILFEDMMLLWLKMIWSR
jgi:hypothetical protein